jgi:hypothetical protein
MKAFQKFVHLSLIVAFLMASVGFRMNLEKCHMGKGEMTSSSSTSACCCGDSAQDHQSPESACQDMTCLLQNGFFGYSTPTNSTEQTTRVLKEPVAYADFAQSIRPALLEKTPHFTLPPPVSGRFLGILHQTFII